MLKKLLTAVILTTVALGAHADFRWGPSLGFNMTEYRFKQKLINIDARPGFSAGVMGELMFPGIGIGLNFGLDYSYYGSAMHFGQQYIWSSSGYGTYDAYLHTLHIPVNLRFKYTRLNGWEKKVAPFVYGGPVFSLTVGHNGVPPLEYSHGSVILQCGLGAEIFRNFQLSGGYYWGMTYEMRTVKLENFSARPQGWFIRAAWLISTARRK